MENVIKWQTGEPKKLDYYIVTTKWGVALEMYLTSIGRWNRLDAEEVIAWCPLSEIDPYKE